MDDFLIYWNNMFPYDRLYRRKYGIPFNSATHRALSPLDVYLDIKEDQIFSQIEKKYAKINSDKEDYKKTGKFLKEREEEVLDEKMISDLYDNLDLEKFNDKKPDE